MYYSDQGFLFNLWIALKLTMAGGALMAIALASWFFARVLINLIVKQDQRMMPRWQHWGVNLVLFLGVMSLGILAVVMGMIGGLLLFSGLAMPFVIVFLTGMVAGMVWFAIKLFNFLRSGPRSVCRYFMAPVATRY